MNPEAIQQLANSSIWPVIEFASIFGIIIVTYMAMHAMFSHLKAPTKMLMSMFLGTLAYSMGKIFVISFLVKPLIF